MGKENFTTLDVACMVKELKSKLVGLRCQNVYNLPSPKAFLIKFAAADEKTHLILESGARLHTTKYEREKDKIPSGFAAKLRKHIKAKRLEDIKQFGMDRVVEFTFGTGELCYHVILEMYAQGNILLTDYKYKILMLLRPVLDGDASERLAVNEMYTRQFTKDTNEAVDRKLIESILYPPAVVAPPPAAAAAVATAAAAKSDDKSAAAAAPAAADAKTTPPPAAAAASETAKPAGKSKPAKSKPAPADDDDGGDDGEGDDGDGDEHDDAGGDDAADTDAETEKHKKPAKAGAVVDPSKTTQTKHQKKLKQEEKRAAQAARKANKEKGKANAAGGNTTAAPQPAAGKGGKSKTAAAAAADAKSKSKPAAAAAAVVAEPAAGGDGDDAGDGKASGKAERERLIKDILASRISFGPPIIEHALLIAGINARQTMKQLGDISSKLDGLVAALNAGAAVLNSIRNAPLPGYVLARLKSKRGGGAGTAAEAAAEAAKGKTKKEKHRERKAKEEQSKNEQAMREREAELGGATGTATASAAVTAKSGAKPQPAAAAAAAADLKAAEDLFGGDAPPPTATATPAAAAATAKPAAAAAAASATDVKSAAATVDDADIAQYVEYFPYLLKQHEKLTAGGDMVIKSFPSFDAAVDAYFSNIEKQKADLTSEKDKVSALKKVEKVRDAHKQKLTALESAAEATERKARLIEANLQLVEAAIGSVNAELAKGTDWRELGKIIKEEKKKGNPIARSIDALKLESNMITLLLVGPPPSDDDGEGEDSDGEAEQKPVQIDIQLDRTAYQNAELYFATKKKTTFKATKTITASAKALKAAEAKTSQALKQVDVKAKIQKLRKVHWFEKFNWFITSENYLVIGGRDAQQNEVLVKKYLKQNDIYMHADVHGASSVCIKNPTGAPVPPATLLQAATMTICRSSAWTNKLLAAAYWVYADQVSKTPPTGTYLTTGSFMIRGKKNYMPGVQLVMGFGLLFRLDAASVARHAGERAIKGSGAQAAAADSKQSKADRETEKEDDPADELNEGDDEGTTEPAAAPAAADAKSADSKDAKSQPAPAAAAAAATPAAAAAADDDDDDAPTLKYLKRQSSTSSTTSSNAATAGVTNGPPVPTATANASTRAVQRASEAASEAETAAAAAAALAASQKKRLSAYDRRLLKKGIQPGSEEAKKLKAAAAADGGDDDDDEDGEGEGDDADEGEDEDDAAPVTAATTTGVKPTPAARGKGVPAAANNNTQKRVPRGKRAKAKRVKAKYGDQDEEDRAIAAQLLGLTLKPAAGTADGKKPAAAAGAATTTDAAGKKSKPAKAADSATAAGAAAASTTGAAPPAATGDSAAAGGVADAKSACYYCKEHGHSFKKCPKRKADELANGGPAAGAAGAAGGAAESLTFKQALSKAKAEEQKAIKKILGEENLDDEKDGAEVNELDSLTGNPHADDVLLYAVPVCAPYSAMTDFKFKVKLVPGKMKKGSIAKASLQLFSRAPTTAAAEKDLIKAMNDNETTLSLIGDCKISAPGLNGAALAGKGGKKAGGGGGGGGGGKKGGVTTIDE